MSNAEMQISEAASSRVDNSAESQQKVREQIMDLFAASSSQLDSAETGVASHPRGPGAPVVSVREDVSDARAAKVLNAHVIAMDEEMVFRLPPEIKCRPLDGAVNVDDLLRKTLGMGSVGKGQMTPFGKMPPMSEPVQVDYDKHRSVPWGVIDFPIFEGEIYIGQKIDPVYGPLFDAYIKCPKKFSKGVDGFWNQLKDHIKKNSIYKGKAITGVGKIDPRTGDYEHPEFNNPFQTDPETVAYSQEVFESLRASVWGPIRTASLQRAAGLKLNRKTLLFGTFGTGKSLAGALTARAATNNGWTFIQTKTGDEDLAKVMKTAELYAPAVVFIEDIDTLIESDPKKMAELLELFDGVSSKNKEVMVLMTSNYIESLTKGMTRVGRIDSAVEIGSLDQTAIQRLISNAFVDREAYDNYEDHGVYEAMSKELTPEDFQLPDGSMLADDVDFEKVFESMNGYEPAFIVGTFNLAKSNAIIRTESLNFKLTTEDFVLAANTLRNQHDTHTNAVDRPAVDTLGETIKAVMGQAAGEQLINHRVNFQENGDIVSVE